MMFLLRSAFWLSIVYAHMPLDGGAALGVVDETRSAVIASAANVVRDKCAEDGAACRALVGAAAGMILAPAAEHSRPVQRADAKPKGARSVNSLTAGDLSPPWRGRPAKSGA